MVGRGLGKLSTEQGLLLFRAPHAGSASFRGWGLPCPPCPALMGNLGMGLYAMFVLNEGEAPRTQWSPCDLPCFILPSMLGGHSGLQLLSASSPAILLLFPDTCLLRTSPNTVPALSVKTLPVLSAGRSQTPTAFLNPVVTTPLQGNSKVTLSYIQTWVTGKALRALLSAVIK